MITNHVKINFNGLKCRGLKKQLYSAKMEIKYVLLVCNNMRHIVFNIVLGF